jgi:hypothetical protein
MAGEPEISFDPTVGPKLILRSPDGLVEKELHLTNDGKLSIDSNNFVKINGTNEIIVSLTDYSRPFVKRTSTSYGTVAYMLFNGTIGDGVPQSIKVLAWSKSATKTFDIRMVRRDTGDVIGEITGNSNDDIQSLDLGTLSNLPTNPTILEIQSKVQTGGEARIASISIKF